MNAVCFCQDDDNITETAEGHDEEVQVNWSIFISLFTCNTQRIYRWRRLHRLYILCNTYAVFTDTFSVSWWCWSWCGKTCPVGNRKCCCQSLWGCFLTAIICGLWNQNYLPRQLLPTHKRTSITWFCSLQAFSVLGPRLWNSLPRLLCDTSHNTTSFGHSLKTSVSLVQTAH